MNNDYSIPETALILLIGSSGSGKSYFANQYFQPDEICCPSSVDMAKLHHHVAQRLKAHQLTVIDAPNLQPEQRLEFIKLAKSYHMLTVGIIFNLDPETCVRQKQGKTDALLVKTIYSQHEQLQTQLPHIQQHEKFHQTLLWKMPEEFSQINFSRSPLPCNLIHETGPFDIIGDLHGCYDELVLLLQRLGYEIQLHGRQKIIHPQQRKLVFLGDLCDRGPNSLGVLRLVMDIVNQQQGYCVLGNHDKKLNRYLHGADVALTYGFETTRDELQQASESFRLEAKHFLNDCFYHYVFDEGKLAVAHAGLQEEFIGRCSGEMANFCLFGPKSSEVDQYGLHIRYPWAKDYRGDTKIIYGHTPVAEAKWVNNTINLDTGCVFGGKLTALRYPECELVSVPASKQYYESLKPIE
ncbi:MAG: metallophosphoesterase [Legionellales bacterium]|nr:metallophosphoesterase [Legionellales bacterium]